MQRRSWWVVVVGSLLALGATTFLGASTAEAQGGAIPRHCGMGSGSEFYGPITPGTSIQLGRHTAWAGDDNWAADMLPYVGRVARVTQLAGVDSAGCPGVRVDVDGGQWFWRIRDAQVAGAPDIPRGCDMTEYNVTYGPIGPGSVVLLGAHTPWRGDANWADGMYPYVGRMGRVTSLEGPDPAGCPVVHVDVDGGQYYWRIRDMHLAGGSMPMGMAAAVPRYCGMTAGAVTYGSLQPGSVVVLGRHSPWDGDTNWAAQMESYVGRRGTITSLEGVDSVGCPVVHVDIDGGQWYWRIRDMTF